jgi:low temperature requirement protein LtrA
MAKVGMRRGVLRPGHGHDAAKVGYVELFFDLVFVFAVTQVSHLLIAHPDGTHLARTLVLGLAVWLVWSFTMWVTNWLDPQRPSVRTMLIVLTALGLVMSGAIPEAFGDKALVFAVPFVVMQVGRSAFTAFALGRHWPENARSFVRIGVWEAVAGVAWIVGALADERTRLWWWVAAVAIECVGPRAMFWVPGLGATKATTWAVRGEHMAERVGLFVIISLGESIIVTGATFAEQPVTGLSFAAFGAAFASTVLMWLLFFDRSERAATAWFASREEPGMVAQTAYTYVPVIFVFGIVLTAVADELVLLHPLESHAGAWTAGLVCGAGAVYLVGNALFRRATGGGWSAPHLAGTAALLLLFLLRDAMTPLALNWVSNAVLLVVILGDVAVSRRSRVAG